MNSHVIATPHAAPSTRPASSRYAIRQRGFSLLEAMVVLGLIAGLIFLGASWLQYQAQSQQQQGQGDMLAREMALVASAVDKAVTADKLPGSTPTDTSRHGAIARLAVNTNLNPPVTIANLVTQGLLPANFANRKNSAGTAAVGTSPYGQPYLIVLRKVPTDPANTASTPVPRAVVYESGAPIASALERSGIQPTADQLLAYKTKVAADTHTLHKRVAAVVRAGERIATNPSWTLDLTSWFTAPLANTAVAALVRFDYLEPGGGVGTPTPGLGFSGDCRVLEASQQCVVNGFPGPCSNPAAVWQPQSCSFFGTGWQQVDTITVCPPAGQASFRATPVGSMSYATNELRNAEEGFCFSPCSSTHTCNKNDILGAGGRWQTDIYQQDIRINDQTVARPECERRLDTNGVVEGGVPLCGYVQVNRVWANGSVIASNPRHILCCLDN